MPPEDAEPHWIAYQTVVESVGGPEIGQALLRAFNHVADIDEVFAYQATATSPRALVSAGDRPGSNERAALYSGGFYKLDPTLDIAPEELSGGILARRVQARDVTDEDYREACFERPGLAEKMSFAMGAASPYVLNLYRLRRRPRLSDLRYAATGRLAQLVLPLIRRHADLVGGLGAPASAEQQLERRLSDLQAGLTPRERAVLARTMMGRTSGQIALDLGVGVTSVLTYRRRAYARVGVSSAAELLSRIVAPAPAPITLD